MTNGYYKRYENYIRYIQCLYGVLYKIKKYRVLLLSCLAVAFSVVLVLLLSMGSFSDDIVLEDFSYGEVAEPHSEAFLSEVTYEYSLVGSDEWSDEAPSVAGEYLVRAVSKNGFGVPQYSEVKAISVAPRDIFLSVKELNIVYGNDSEYTLDRVDVSGLINGDSISEITFEYEQISKTRVNVKIGTVVISNQEGEDVTASYNIHTENGGYNITPRYVVVQTETITKPYDGKVLTGEKESVISGSLADGDTLNILTRAEITDIGSVENIVTFDIVNPEGVNVSEFYNVESIFGTLSIVPRDIKISTPSSKKTYDALPLIDSNYTVSSGELIEGHRFEFEFPSITGVGKIDNLPTYKIVNALGEDYTEKYNVEIATGKLEVTPVTLKFKTQDKGKVYDGTPLKDENGWELVSGEVPSPDKLVVTHTGSQLDAGSSKNTISVKVLSKDGNDVTDIGYKIEVEEGTLTVEKRPVTITSKSASKKYDGSPLVCKEYTTNGAVAGEDFVLNFTGIQVSEGSSDNKFSVTGVVNRYGTVLKNNYTITSEFGTLTVTPGKETNKPSSSNDQEEPRENNDNHSTGDSSNAGHSPQKHDETTISFPNLGEKANDVVARVSFLSNHTPERIYLRQVSYGNYNGLGWEKAPQYTAYGAQNTLYYTGMTLQKNGVKSVSLEVEGLSDGLAFLPNYCTSMSNNTLVANDIKIAYTDRIQTFVVYPCDSYETINSMTTYPLTGEERYRKHVYDTYLDIPDTTKAKLLEIAKENGISKDSSTFVTDIQNYVRSAATYDLNASSLYPNDIEDIAIYFLTVAKRGVCQHYATAATLMYRAFGIPARYVSGYATVATYGTKTDVFVKNSHAWTEIYLDGKGWVTIEATGSDGQDTAHGHSNQEIDLPNGLADIVVTAYSRSKEYDGQPFSEWSYDKAWISQGALLDGHTLKVTVEELGRAIADAGVTENKITSVKIVDKNGKDVTDMYSIYCASGESTILQRQITIQTGSATKVYDGSPLKNSEYWIVRGSILPEHTLTANLYTTITQVGTSKNRASVYIRDRQTLSTVLKNYKVTVEYGTLTVVK